MLYGIKPRCTVELDPVSAWYQEQLAYSVEELMISGISLKKGLSIAPALPLLALGLVLFFGEVVFRRWLGPLFGITVENMADFTIWPEMLFIGILFPYDRINHGTIISQLRCK